MAPRYPKIKVALIDDEVTITQLLKGFLSDSRLFDPENIFSFNNPFEAISSLKNQTADIVVCDYRMPGMNGDLLIKAVKELNPDVKTILFSGTAITSLSNFQKKIEEVVDLVIEKLPDQKYFVNMVDLMAASSIKN